MNALDLAYEAWPDQTPPPVVRLRDAIEETYAAAHALDLDPEALYAAQAPFAVRADVWCFHVDRLLRAAP